MTPTSYLELLGTLIRLLAAKRTEIVEGRRRLEVGLQKLISTAQQVEVMQAELRDLQPILEKTSREVEDMMVVITNDKKEAGELTQQLSLSFLFFLLFFGLVFLLVLQHPFQVFILSFITYSTSL